MNQISETQDKVSECLSDLIEILQKYRLTIADLLVVYGNLGYAIGASIEGYEEKGPSIDELNREYYANPRPGIALMIQGWQTTLWEKDLFEYQKRQQKLKDEETGED